MTRFFPMVLAAGALLVPALAPEIANAQDDTRGDIRCLLAFGAMLKNPAYKDAAGAGMFYFIGRIDEREPKIDLAAAMKREIGNMQSSDYATEAQRCGVLLKQRNEALKAAGDAVKGAR